MYDLNCAAPLSKLAQRPRNVKGHWQDYFVVRRDLLAASVFDRDDTADTDDLRGLGVELEDARSKTAGRIQATGGSPSSIFCHVLPSSVELNSLPLRVPK